MTTPTSTQRRFPSSSLFHLITMGSTPQPRRKPEPMWKTPKMLRKKKRGTRYPPTTGKTLDVVTDPKTPTRLLPPPRPTTPDHDYISVDRNNTTSTPSTATTPSTMTSTSTCTSRATNISSVVL
jgi:hypothetical protein